MLSSSPIMMLPGQCHTLNTDDDDDEDDNGYDGGDDNDDKKENDDNDDTAGLEISAACDAMLEEEEPRTMLKVLQCLYCVNIFVNI